MKILVVSLLRLGDAVLSTPVLKGLRERHPQAQIDILINSQFMGFAPLMPFVDNVFGFDRDLLQKGLGEADRTVFESYDRVRALIKELNDQNYNLVINLTQNRLSGWLTGLINANEKRGLEFDSRGQVAFGSAWFECLNRQVESDGRDFFHFSDVFQFATDMATPRHGISLRETTRGEQEANQILEGHNSFILIQALTSDKKKDWGLTQWQQAVKLFSLSHPRVSILFLSAPNEKERLEPLVKSLADDRVPARLVVADLEVVLSLLKRAKLLVTGDTSIKHLACAVSTRILEISIGSSDLFRTGSYKHGALILQSNEVCAPCSHSRDCSRERQFCAERLSVECVSMFMREVYESPSLLATPQIKTLAEEFKDEVTVYRVDFRTGSFWSAYNVLEGFNDSSVGRWLDMYGWKIFLEQRRLEKEREKVSTVGSEALHLGRLLREIHPEVAEFDWRHIFADLEKVALTAQTRMQSIETGLKLLCGNYEEPERMQLFVRSLMHLRRHFKPLPFLQTQTPLLDDLIEDSVSQPFVRLRKMQKFIREIQSRTEIEIKILRTLQNHLELTSERT